MGMPTPEQLLKKMAAIRLMERGKLCSMQKGKHFNHQVWRNGRNEVRYISNDQLPHMKKSIAGYTRFMKLVDQYVDLAVARSRKEAGKRGNSGAR